MACRGGGRKLKARYIVVGIFTCHGRQLIRRAGTRQRGSRKRHISCLLIGAGRQAIEPTRNEAMQHGTSRSALVGGRRRGRWRRRGRPRARAARYSIDEGEGAKSSFLIARAGGMCVKASAVSPVCCARRDAKCIIAYHQSLNSVGKKRLAWHNDRRRDGACNKCGDGRSNEGKS